MAISLSPDVSPAFPSTKNMITSASSIATSACCLILVIISSFESVSIPPVSIKSISWLRHCVYPYILSLVTPLSSCTMESFLPMSLLKNVDLPVFGLPIIAAVTLFIITPRHKINHARVFHEKILWHQTHIYLLSFRLYPYILRESYRHPLWSRLFRP